MNQWKFSSVGWSAWLVVCLCAPLVAQTPAESSPSGLATSNQSAASNAVTSNATALERRILTDFALRNTDPEEAQALLEGHKAEAEAALEFNALARATHYLAVLGHQLAQYEETEAMLDRVLLSYRQRFSAHDRGLLELWQGRLWYRQGDMERAEARFSALEEEFQGQDLLADIYLNQGVLAHAKGLFDESVAKGLAALRLFEAQGDIEGQIMAHKDLGIDYLRIDDLDSSLFHFEAGKALLEQSEDVHVAMELSANMGITLQEMGDLEGALGAYEWTFESAKTLNRPLTQAQSLLNIGTIYSNDYKDFEQAIDYYQRSLVISEANEMDYGVMLNHMNIGVALGGLGRSDEALAAFDRAYEMAVAMDRPNETQFLLGQKAEVLAEAGRYQEAYETTEAQKAIAETIFNERRDRAIADLRVEYETELKEQALALAEARNEQQSQWIRFLWALIALVLALGAVGGGFLIYRNRALKELYERNIELVDAFYGAQARAQSGTEAETDPLKALFDRLLVLIEKEGLFKDEQLSLAVLARQAQSNEKYVSQAISRYANMNFANFINYYRINEAKKLLRAADEKAGVTDVMLECGFSHKSTFYAAFKKFTGMTPTQFRAVAQQESARAVQSPQNIGISIQ